MGRRSSGGRRAGGGGPVVTVATAAGSTGTLGLAVVGAGARLADPRRADALCPPAGRWHHGPCDRRPPVGTDCGPAGALRPSAGVPHRCAGTTPETVARATTAACSRTPTRQPGPSPAASSRQRGATRPRRWAGQDADPPPGAERSTGRGCRRGRVVTTAHRHRAVPSGSTASVVRHVAVPADRRGAGDRWSGPVVRTAGARGRWSAWSAGHGVGGSALGGELPQGVRRPEGQQDVAGCDRALDVVPAVETLGPA